MDKPLILERTYSVEYKAIPFIALPTAYTTVCLRHLHLRYATLLGNFVTFKI